MLEAFLRKLYAGFDTDTSIEAGVWRELLRVINEATVEGLSRAALAPTHADDFLRNLRHSNEVFAAFKTHTMGIEMAAKLIDDKGNLKPFHEWRRDVEPIASHQVGAWLQTEYDTAVIRAHAAADWQEFERNKDVMPNLRWMRTTSPNPEAGHRAYWEMGLCLPVDDPFWNDNHPGNRWNCKCSLEACDDPVVRPVDPFQAEPPQRGLENNPGKDAHLFNQTHPYFPKSCSSCSFNQNLKNNWLGFFSKKNREKECYMCGNIDAILQTIRPTKRTEFESGGVLEEAGEQGKEEARKNRIAYEELARTKGAQYRLLPKHNRQGEASPDALNLITRELSDVKVPDSNDGKNAIQNSISSASSQKVGEVYIYLTKPYDSKSIHDGLQAGFYGGRAKTIKTVIIRYSNGHIQYFDTADIRKGNIKIEGS